MILYSNETKANNKCKYCFNLVKLFLLHNITFKSKDKLFIFLKIEYN